MTELYLGEVLNAVYPQVWVRILDVQRNQIAFQHAKELVADADKLGLPLDAEIIGVNVQDYTLELQLACNA